MLHSAARALLVSSMLCCSTLVPARDLAQKAVEPTTDIDELIERVEEFESFRATYRIFAADGREGLMYWSYVADDKARATLEAAGETRDLFWIDGGKMTAGALGRDGSAYFVGIDVGARIVEYESVNDLLDQKFPSATAPPFEPHLQFSIVLDSETDKTDISVGIVDRRSSLLAWLTPLRSREPVEQDDPAVLVFEHKDRRYEISAVNGFITRAWVGEDDDRRLAVELVQLELDVEIDDDDMQAPEWTQTEDEIDAGFRRAMLNTLRQNARETVATRLQHLHDQGEFEWPEDGPEGLEDILRELHTVATQEDSTDYLEKIEDQFATRVENLTEWADGLREDPRMPEQLAALKATARAELETVLESIVEIRVNRLGSPSGRDLSIEDDFLEVERRALRAALEATLRDAALERYDETVGAVE